MPNNSSQPSINFNCAADFYDATRGFPPDQEQSIAQFIAGKSGLSASSNVLEIGIGTGRIALPLAQFVRRYNGIDISIEMMERLRQKQNGQPISLAEADATQLPFATGKFDAIIVVHVFHLVSSLEAVLSELKRVLRPEGVLIHGWNRGESGPLWHLRDSWRKAVQNPAKPLREWDTIDSVITDAGWLVEGATEAHSYTVAAVPQNTVTSFANRVWSATWKLSDEEHAAGLAAMQATLHELFADPLHPVEFETAFQMRRYRPGA